MNKNKAEPLRTDTDFISVYRVSLIKEQDVIFESTALKNSVQAQGIIKKLIETKGQPDRAQFCVILLNAKNQIIGVNIVSAGSLVSTTVEAREVLKPAILANAVALILVHNHPSNELTPSDPDIHITRKIIWAAETMGIQVHEHLIISMDDNDYYSFADQGIISSIYAEIKKWHSKF
jgi:DNA repair protein RadC